MSKVTAAVADASRDFGKGLRSFPGSLRTAIKDPRSLTAGAPVAPIVVLFCHTFLDAFDRTGFAIILPEVQDYFDLDLEQVTGLASISIVAGILLSLPAAMWSDRSGHRTWFLAGGAFVASTFSLGAGVATTIGLFGASRAGFGFGLLVNDPVQQSLLSDTTPVPARASVFAGRQMADNLGGLLGPLAFGILTLAFGWRAPLFAVAAFGLMLGVASVRLKEPSRGTMERAAMGLTGDELDVEEDTAGFRESWRILKAIPTVRTLWYSLPFLLGGVLGIFVLIPLYLEDVFDMSAGERGLAQALMGIPAIFGLFVGIALTKRFLFSETPWRMFRLMAAIAFGIGMCVVWLAVAPSLWLVLMGMTLLFLLAALVLPGYGTLLSIVMPARARTVGFALTRLWALPGLVMLPIAGNIGDAHGLDVGILAGVPVFLAGALVVGFGGKSFLEDMAKAHEASVAAVEAHRGRVAQAAMGDDDPDPEPALTDSGL